MLTVDCLRACEWCGVTDTRLTAMPADGAIVYYHRSCKRAATRFLLDVINICAVPQQETVPCELVFDRGTWTFSLRQYSAPLQYNKKFDFLNKK